MSELLEYRKKHNLSQKAFAKLIGISQATVCDYERGVKRPSPKTALKIQKITNINASNLIFFNVNELSNLDDQP